MPTANIPNHSHQIGHRKQGSSQGNSISKLPVEMILDVLANATSFQNLRTLIQCSLNNQKVMQVFMLNKDLIYTSVAKRQFVPLEDALAAASMATLHAPIEELDELDDPTAPLTLLSEREGNNKSLRIRDKGPLDLEERIQKLLLNDYIVSELEILYEERTHGVGYELSSSEKATFRQSLYRVWAFTTGVPRFATRCVFDSEDVKGQYWEVRFLSRYSAKDICEIGKVYSFLVGLVIDCCRRCRHQEFFEPDSCRNGNDEEYLSDVIGYHISKGPNAVLELYKTAMAETNPSKISRKVAWGAVGYQRFLISDLEYVWYNKYSGLNFRQKSFRQNAKDAICS
ncbi:hypothetical protein H072_4405 [Dactylellina haptotyla CBS 200.50]|uniref:Uncharacterized protein n=1 Tax=Dactylellina haptotyla (strain CBS 200.50) TaxID=1284197 RepID=S8AFK9_DACHA|nr:hypothetical protein H072_4405 [Dactylellina haptotyla CBS 200.50]